MGALAMVACSGGGGRAGAAASDGGGEGGGTGDVVQSGKIVAFGTSGTAIPGVDVALGGRQGKTDQNGLYSIKVPPGVPYEMVLSAPGYFKAISQEWSIDGDINRGSTNFVSESEWTTFIAAFESLGGVPRDPTLGLVALLVLALPPCTTTGGATVSITPSLDSTRILYVDDNGAPSANTTTSAQPLPVHALVYNAPVGPVSMSIASPSCSQLPWPVTATVPAPGSGSFTDTGQARVESGSAVSYLRVYLGQ
jgi:hypothetical protein